MKATAPPELIALQSLVLLLSPEWLDPFDRQQSLQVLPLFRFDPTSIGQEGLSESPPPPPT